MALSAGILIGALLARNSHDIMTPSFAAAASRATDGEEAVHDLLRRARESPRDSLGLRKFPESLLGDARVLLPALGSLIVDGREVENLPVVLDLIRQIGPDARSVLPQVCRSLESGTPSDSRGDLLAGLALDSICSDRRAAIHELGLLRDSRSEDARSGATCILQALGGDTRDCFLLLQGYLADASPTVRADAAAALRGLATRFEAALDAVEPSVAHAATLDPDEQVRDYATGVLLRGGFRRGTAFGLLSRGIREGVLGRDEVRTLILFPPSYPEELDRDVLRMMQDTDPGVRRWGVLLDYAGIQRTRVGILPRLRRYMKDDDPGVREQARKAMDWLEGRDG